MIKYISGIVLLCFVGYTELFAQVDSSKFDLKEVEVKENRMQIPFLKVSQNITLITKANIQATPARSVQELLAFTPGIDVRQRGISGVQADIGIRGGSFEQTLLLVNGIKLSDPQTGHHMMNIPLPLQAIERIDVLKGPGSRIFGQNAYAGAINIITALPEKKSIVVQGFGGDFGMLGGNVYAALPIGKYKQVVSASHDASKGYWHNSDFKVSNMYYESGFNLNKKNQIRSMVGYTLRDFGANGFYSNRFPDQWEATKTLLTSISHTYANKNLYIQTRAYWRKNDDEFRLKRNEPAFYTNIHKTEVLAAEINAAYTSKLGKTGFGIENRKELISSTNLGDRDRMLSGVVIEHRVEFLKNAVLRAGMYSNYYSEYGWKHFPGAELGYQLSTQSRVYANFGKSYRIPTYTELYYEDLSNSSNSELKPEESLSYEAGYKYNGKKISGEVVVFNRNSSNMIDYFRPASDSVVNPNKWSPSNIGSVTFLGIETAINYAVNLGSNKVSLKNIGLSYNYIDASVDKEASIESRYALSALKHQLIGRVQLNFFKHADLQVNTRFIERMALSPYFLLDAKLNLKLPYKAGCFMEVSNITNTNYTEAGFLQMPGRWFKIGLQIAIL
jgi:vitamin B12 transporter